LFFAKKTLLTTGIRKNVYYVRIYSNGDQKNKKLRSRNKKVGVKLLYKAHQNNN